MAESFISPRRDWNSCEVGVQIENEKRFMCVEEDLVCMPEKASNKVKKKADKVFRKFTNEEYNGDSGRYRDKDDKKFTRGPNDEKDENDEKDD